MATPRQLESYQLHKDCCVGNGVPQSSIFHRKTEGTLVQVGPQGLNTEYTPPDPRSTDMPLNAGVPVWAIWEGLNLRGIGQDGGDTQASRMWVERFLVQFPAIDDSGAIVSVQDDDLMADPTGVRFKLENPVLSTDGSYWKAIGMVLR